MSQAFMSPRSTGNRAPAAPQVAHEEPRAALPVGLAGHVRIVTPSRDVVEPHQCPPLLMDVDVISISLTWGRIQSHSVEPAVLQNSGVMDRARIPHKGVDEEALPITYCLQLYGWEELPVEVILALRS